ncbi:MAG: hypothetical protein AAF658_20530 [Myxococcota bacterium]
MRTVRELKNDEGHGCRLIVAACLFLGSGCMTVYHPLRGLQRPTLVELNAPNFAQTAIELRCIEGGALDRDGARRLCQFIRQVFENQGATVFDRTEIAFADAEDLEAESPTELIVELRSRETASDVNYSSQFLSVVTLTLVPAIREESVAQTVIIRDAGGRELAQETLEWRMRHYVGIGIVGVNYLLDVTARDEDDTLTGDVADERFSRDLYRQVSQIAFNAKQRLDLTRSP